MNGKKSIHRFLIDSTIDGKPVFFKIVVGRYGGMLQYTKYFAVNKELKILTYTIVHPSPNNYSYKGNSKMMRNEITLNTVLCNYNSYYKGGRVETITLKEFKETKPTDLDISIYEK